jgi:hypothetical protein
MSGGIGARGILAPFTLVLPLLHAQSATLQGPTSGFLYDPTSRAIRPILGIPGSAHLGSPVYSNLDYASVAPDGQIAIGVANGQTLFIGGISGAQPTASPITGAIGNTNRVLWAADSTAAVMCGAEQCQHLTGLPSAGVAGQPVELPSTALHGRVTTVAADPSAQNIAVGVIAEIRGRSAGGIFFIPASGTASLLASMDAPSAAAFTPDGQDLYAADRATANVWAFHNVGPGAMGVLALDASTGITNPVGIAVSSQQLFVAGAKGVVQVYNLPALALSAELPLEVPPSGMEPVPGSTYYRLIPVQSSSSELWMLNTQPPSVFFVPPGQ